MSDTRDTLPTGGDAYPAGTSSPAGSPTTTPAVGGTSVHSSTGTPSSSSSGAGNRGGMETAKQEASNVMGTAKDEAANVAQTAKEEVKEVGREARTQVRRLYDNARMEVRDQAAHRQEKLSNGLRSASQELRGMADSSTGGGMATDLVRQASERLDGAASWLGARDPGALVDEAKRYARRRPVVFLAVAALAGVVVGRLTRSMAAGSPDDDRQIGDGYGAYHSDGTYRPEGAYRTDGTYATSGTTGSTAGYGTRAGGAYGSESDDLGMSSNTTRAGGADDVSDPLYRSGEQG